MNQAAHEQAPVARSSTTRLRKAKPPHRSHSRLSLRRPKQPQQHPQPQQHHHQHLGTAAAARSLSHDDSHTNTAAARAASIDHHRSSLPWKQPSHAHAYAAPGTDQLRYSLSDKSRTDLLGQRFDSLAVINSFDAISYGDHKPQHDAQPQAQSQPHTPTFAPNLDEPLPQRPSQPQHSHSTSSASKSIRERAASRLDQSLAAAGRRMEDLTPRAGDSGARSPRQRYSDEAREGNKLKKKSGFSSFMNNLVGAPRKPTISAPENPVHVTHVGYDQNTGEFTVRIVLSRLDMWMAVATTQLSFTSCLASSSKIFFQAN